MGRPVTGGVIISEPVRG